jgi:hypothetical protein
MIPHPLAYWLKKTKRSISDTRMLLGYTGSSPLESEVCGASSMLMEFFREIVRLFFEHVKVFPEVADKPPW